MRVVTYLRIARTFYTCFRVRILGQNLERVRLENEEFIIQL